MVSLELGHPKSELRHSYYKSALAPEDYPRAQSLPSSDQFPLTTFLKMYTLDPSMMLSPDPHNDITSILHPLVEQTDYTISET
jgi:hypothetical protein